MTDFNVSNWIGAEPLPPLYSRTSKGAINVWSCWVEGDEVCVRWGQQDGKQQNARFKTEAKNLGRSNATTAEEQAILEAVSKWTAQQRKKYKTSLEDAKTNTDIKPMLAQEWSKQKHKLVWPVFGQKKFDGLRAMTYLKDGRPVLHSRGNKFYNLPHVEQALVSLLKPGMVLDGELYRHGVSLQTINSYVRGQKPEATDIQYHIYDMVSDKPFAGRKEELQRLIDDWAIPSVYTPIVLVDTVELQSEEAVIRYQAACVKEGYEGCMVRSASGKYRYGYRSPDLLKVKSWLTEEFTIAAWFRGKGKFENVPTFQCLVDPNKSATEDNTFDVTPVGTMQERKEMLDNAHNLLGKLLTVKFFGFSPDDHKPLYPTGISIRHEEDM